MSLTVQSRRLRLRARARAKADVLSRLDMLLRRRVVAGYVSFVR
jgi:hypothetical protein